MLKYLVLLLIIVLSGCVSNEPITKHKIAISSDSERIAYSTIGTGEVTLILIHGWSCDGRYWQHQVNELSHNYKIITIDLAGHGYSSLDRNNYTMVSYAHDIKAVIEQEKVESAILVGHSMGGGVIAEAARLMPEKVDGLVGIDTLHSVAEQVPQTELDAMVNSFELDFKMATREFVSSMFPQGTSQQLVTWVKEDMSSALKNVALSAFKNYLGQYVNGEAANVFKSINVPVVSINARLWPTAPHLNKLHINDYQVYYIEESGHFPMLEKPKEFNKLLKKAINIIELKN